MAMSSQPVAPRVQSVSRAMGILVAVATSPAGLTAREISEKLGLNRPTAYHLLRTLHDEAFLMRGSDRRYRLGLRVGTLAEGFARQLVPDESLTPYVRLLAEKTSETTYLTVRRGVEVVLLTFSVARHTIQARAPVIGLLDDIHSRSSGKVSLAYAPPDVLDEYFETHVLRRLTKNTITDRRKLKREFALVRERGYAVSREEHEIGVCTMAAPIDQGASPFVLALSAPTDRFDANFDDYLAELLEVTEMASSSSATAAADQESSR
jgi:IclR family transcriptional regulator, acetate operon repressor